MYFTLISTWDADHENQPNHGQIPYPGNESIYTTKREKEHHRLKHCKISPTYPWKIPQMFHQQFMKDFLSLWGFGEVWGIFKGYVGKIFQTWIFGNILVPWRGTNWLRPLLYHKFWTRWMWPIEVCSFMCSARWRWVSYQLQGVMVKNLAKVESCNCYCWWFRNPKQPPVGCTKPCKWWDMFHFNWCTTSSSNSISALF